MPVKEADPDAKSLDEAFSAAMGTPARPAEPAAPPAVDPDAPFGREDDGAAKAPYGLTKDGKPRRSNAGRKPRDPDDAPRTGPPADGPGAPAGGGGNAAPEGKDYSAALSDFGDALWFGASALGKGGSAIPLIGKHIPERKVAAQAGVFRTFKPSLVNAVNIAAQHNAKAARFAASVESGDITWVVMVGFMVMPFMTMSAAIWKDSDENPALAMAELPSLTELAEQNDKQLDAYLASITAQMEAMAEQQQAEAIAAMGDTPDTAHP
jgi:hypothetical protein